MIVVVTNNVPERFRGFLASVMLEIAAGVYVSPRMTAGIRERIWSVLNEWFNAIGTGSVIMAWMDRREASGLALCTLGVPPREFMEIDGVFTTRADMTAEKQEFLNKIMELGASGTLSTTESRPDPETR